jgi:ABC-type multidrug transport system fused ATPase/permease subunit
LDEATSGETIFHLFLFLNVCVSSHFSFRLYLFTTALDAESEHMVQEAIDHMLEAGRSQGNGTGMTVMIVAHRLSTIRNADIIFVVQDGQVIEQGNHAELAENQDGAYSNLIRRQMLVQKKLDDSKPE